jgi:predicted ArsR family transcriptional regulator
MRFLSILPVIPTRSQPQAESGELSEVTDGLGYDARTGQNIDDAPTIEADNCVFHELALKNPEVCQFNLALLSGFSDSKMELTGCMARSGHVCRFRF